MAYGTGEYPSELANKVGHVKLINDPMIQRVIEAFEDYRAIDSQYLPEPTGSVDMSVGSGIRQVITVDGGHQIVPNVVFPQRQVGFVQVAAQMLKMELLEELIEHPMADPREIRKQLSSLTHHTLAALPLAGLSLGNQTLTATLRDTIHRFLSHYELYETLSFLVFREWDPSNSDVPRMDCLGCGAQLTIERGQIRFRCDSCGEDHTLSDYLGLVVQDVEDRAQEEMLSGFRAVIEVLVLFSFITKHLNRDTVMARTLFVLDGPLLLRAQLSRLVEPIRDLIRFQTARQRPIHLIGVEKSGAFSDFGAIVGQRLPNVGDFFLPSVQFLMERVYGRKFDPSTYRNRVSYGSRVLFRAGRDHLVVIHLPTGPHLIEPMPDDLVGFPEIARILPKLISYRYENALIPIVLVNTEASISNTPSNGMLNQFVDRLVARDDVDF